jgi:hypothetical protein
MTDWMNLLCWYIFIIMLCDHVTNAQPYTVSSLIYICCILHYFSKWTKYFQRSETREKKNRQYIYIVENITFIYTSFDEVFLPVSQRVEMNYIFCKSKLNNDIVFHIKYAWIIIVCIQLHVYNSYLLLCDLERSIDLNKVALYWQ